MRTIVVALSVGLLFLASTLIALADKPDDPDRGRHGRDDTPSATVVTSTPTATSTVTASASPTATSTPQADSDGDGDRDRGRDKDKDWNGDSQGASEKQHNKKASVNGTVENLYADGFDVAPGQGDVVRVFVGEQTEYSAKGSDSVGLADVTVSNRVHVKGEYDSSNPPRLVADRVHLVPNRIVVVGDVTGLDRNGDELTGITVRSDETGDEQHFAVTSATKVVGAGDVATGSEVTVLGMKDGSATAKQIVVHAPDDDQD